MVHQEDAKVGEVFDVEKLAQWTAIAPTGHAFGTADFRLVEAADQCGQHVTVFRMVIVVRTVEICRHHADVVGAVLTVEVLAVLQSADLGQGVSLVGGFQRGGQQTTLRHGLWRKTRIDAAAAEKFQFLATVLPRRMDDIHFEDHVLVHEIRQSTLIGDNAPDLCCREEDVFGLLLREEGLHIHLTGEVEFLVGSSDDVMVSLPLQLAHNSRANHAAMPRDVYFTILLHINLRLNDLFLHLKTRKIRKHEINLVFSG